MSSVIHNEAVTILAEECSEVIQVCTKILRFGTGSEWDGKTKIENLESEIGDVLASIEILLELNIISKENLEKAKHDKFRRLAKWSSIMSVEGPNGLLKNAQPESGA